MSLKNWLKIIIFIISAGLILAGLSCFLDVPEGRDACGMYGYRFEEKDSIDVLLMGPSTTYTSFYSPLAYEKEGFTSFSVSTGNMTGLMYPYVLADALLSQSPSLIVVDMAGLAEKEQYDSFAYHRWADSIPRSPVREAFVNTIVEEEDRDSFKYTFLAYHDNWTRAGGCLKALIDRGDIRRQGYSITKNFCAYTDIYDRPVATFDYESSESALAATTMFLDYLEENSLANVIFVRYPMHGKPVDGELYLQLVEAIKEAGYEYIDLADLNAIDKSSDFFDEDHVNISGAWKVTGYLSALIADNYRLSYGYSPLTAERWADCASRNNEIYEKVLQLTLEHQNEGLYTQRDFLE